MSARRGGSASWCRGCNRLRPTGQSARRRARSWTAGSAGPITAAPVTQASRWSPSSPSQRTSRCSGESTTIPSGRLSTNARYQHGRTNAPGWAPHNRRGSRDRSGRQAGLVGADDSEPVVVVGPLRAVGRQPRPESAAQVERGRQTVCMDPHERVPETVHAAVALIARAGLRAHGCRFARSTRIDLRADTGDQAVRETSTAARIVALRQVVHQRRERHAALMRIRATYRVHQSVAAREEEASLAPGGVRDCLHRRPGIVPALHRRQELVRPAVPRGVGKEVPATLELDDRGRGGRLVSAGAKHEHSDGDRRRLPQARG